MHVYIYAHVQYMITKSVTPEKKCATLCSCFWLVGRHQQGVAHLLSGVTELYRTQSADPAGTIAFYIMHMPSTLLVASRDIQVQLDLG